MQRKPTILEVLTAAVLAAVAHHAAAARAADECPNKYVTVTTARFTPGRTEIKSADFPLTFTLPDIKVRGVPGHVSLRNERLMFTYIITAKSSDRLSSLLNEYCGVYVLADGKPVKTWGYEASLSGHVIVTTVLPGEMGAGIYPNKVTSLDALAQLGAAGKIEFKTCLGEAVAPPAFVAAAHEFACVEAEKKAAQDAARAAAFHVPTAAEAWDACIQHIVAISRADIGVPPYEPALLVKSSADSTTNHFDFRATLSVIGGSHQEWTCSIDYERGVSKLPEIAKVTP